MAEVARRKAGYSLLEMLIVLAIMALATALIVPRASGAMDQIVAHSVFFDFQRQVSDLRRRAYHQQQGFELISTPGQATPPEPDPDLTQESLNLRSGWSYVLSAPLVITPGGVCGKVTADLSKGGRVVVHLTPTDEACHFLRTG